MNKFYKQKFNTREISVLVSDEEESLRKALKNRIPAIACIGEDTEYKLSFVPYAVEDEGAIDEDYLRFVYCRTNGIPLEIARTERLLIRELCADDREKTRKVFLDNGEDAFSISGEELQSYSTRVYDLYRYGYYAVCLLENPDIMIGIAGFNRQKGCIELGYIIRKEYRRQGYAFEACTELLNLYEKDPTVGEETVTIIISKDNFASLSLAKKLKDRMAGSRICPEIKVV